MALYALQHRGQMSCGIAVGDHGVIKSYKDNGLVPEVFSRDVLDSLGDGHIAVGHVRYGTSDNADRANAQPMVVRHVRGNIALCFNGQLTNAQELRRELELSGAIFHTTNDCEVIAYVFTRERLKTASTEEALAETMKKLRGAYSIVMMSAKKLLACRDPQGFHPLCIGKREGQIIFASETCALSTLNAEIVRDVAPGEIVVASEKGLDSIPALCGQKSGLCVFEFVYFARPDSIIDGAGVHQARQRAGAYLALEHPVAADVVVGAPDSGLDAAIAAYYVIGPAEAFSNLARFDGIRYGYQEEGCANLSDQSSLSRAHGFGAEAKRRQMLGAYLLSSGVYDKYYYAAQKARTLITQDYDAAYAKVDTILMPASPRTAFKFGEISDPTQMYLSDLYTISLNICGNGGVSVPLGLGEDTQLPVSAQLVGPAFKDRQLLTFARALERGFADDATGAPALSVAPDFAGKGGEL